LSVAPGSHRVAHSRSQATTRIREDPTIAADPVATRRRQIDWLTMTDATPIGPTLKAWNKLRSSRFGRWLFARTVCRRAPYFATIRPRFVELGPAVCRVSMPKRRSVQNHIGTEVVRAVITMYVTARAG